MYSTNQLITYLSIKRRWNYIFDFQNSFTNLTSCFSSNRIVIYQSCVGEFLIFNTLFSRVFFLMVELSVASATFLKFHFTFTSFFKFQIFLFTKSADYWSCKSVAEWSRLLRVYLPAGLPQISPVDSQQLSKQLICK